MARTLRWIAALVALGTVAAAAGVGALWWIFLRDLPDFHSLEDYDPPLTSVVLDRQGRPIGEFYEFRRRLTPLEEVPPRVIQAFLAAEDDTFFQHEGVDFASILRAAWANLRAGGEVRQGASTITQQMVKQLLLSSERTYRRKIRELFLARRIEKNFTKQEILYLYLNEIYFGSGAYGIGEAARTYFGKEVAELDAGEAALLAGLPKAPSANSPFVDPERAEARRQYVLERMRAEGFLSEQAWREAAATPPELASPRRPDFEVASYFVEEVRRRLVERLGNEPLLRGGLRIETTLDLELQHEAVESVRAGLEAYDRRRGWRGPLRHVEPAALPSAIQEVARANHLDPDEHARLALAEAPADRVWEGVVVDLEPEAARVALAPELEVRVPAETLAWARRPDASRGATGPGRTFLVGDVAHFRVLRTDTGDAAAAPASPEEAAPLEARLYQKPEVQGALLSFSLESGDVLALVGGYDFEASEFDRATQALRQPGSAFKPLVYATALGAGFTPASIVYDRPVVYDDASGFTWRPENYGRRFLGPLTLRDALARSVNNATIHLLADVGVDRVMEMARKLGVRSPMERNLGMALGTNELSLLEITRAYAVFPAGGVRVEPRFVTRVWSHEGELLLESLPLDPEAEAAGGQATSPSEGSPDRDNATAARKEPSAGTLSLARSEAASAEEPDRVMPEAQAFLATSLLRGVVEHPRGTGRRARALGRPLGGKTGTTNDQGDAWFVGFSPQLLTGVWVGFDEKRVLGPGETGGRAALPIWLDYMDDALAGEPVRDFPVPEGIVFARIDPETGKLASAATEKPLFQPFLEGTEPTRQASEATTADRRRRLQREF